MSQANEVELEMLALINAERADAGLNPLLLNTALNEAAEDHSAWMLDQNTFSHTGIGGSSAGDRIEDADFPLEGRYAWAENIGWQSERGAPGISDDVADIHESLMASPGHRANLLDPLLTEIGIGVEQGDFETARGTFDGVMITQNFAATDGDISALRDTGTMSDVMDENPVAEDDAPEDVPVPEMEEPIAEDTPEEPSPLPAGEDVDAPVAEDDVEDDPDLDDDDMAEDADDDPVDPENDDTEDMEDDTPDPAPDPDTPVAEAPVDEVPDEEMPDEEMEEGDAPEPTSPVAPMPEPQVPTLAGLFVDFSDAFEFRQEGEKLIFETSFDALFTSLINTFEEAFGVEVALDVVDDMVPPMMPEPDVIPDMSLDCA